MKRMILALVLLALPGCVYTQTNATATCTYEARKQYPEMNSALGGNKYGAYLIDCMAAAGYVYDYRPKECLYSDWMAANPYCYRPRNGLLNALYQAELVVRGWWS